MMLKWHLPFYQEIFTISHFLQDPILTFGYQGIEKQAPAAANPFVPRLRRLLASEAKMRRLVKFARSSLKWSASVPKDFQYDSLTDLLISRGHSTTTLDYFDGRADLRYDMNRPVPEFEHNKYGTLIDIGCLEHLFDTAGCLENCIRMVRRGVPPQFEMEKTFFRLRYGERMRNERKHYTAEEKVTILRRHLLDKVPVSDLCEELGLRPTVFYRWQKEFFENGSAAFQSKERPARQVEEKQKRIEFLEKKVQTKDEVLAELMAEHIALKKSLGEL